MATRTARLGLAKPAAADRTWDVPLNANADALDAGPLGSLAVRAHESPSTSLLIDVGAGAFVNAAGVYTSYAGVSGFAIGASLTRSVWLTDAAVLTVGASYPAPATNHVRLGVVVTGVATVTSIAPPAMLPVRSASS